ncbi:hypothetical protein FKM82_018635 [Ascaphus truei]
MVIVSTKEEPSENVSDQSSDIPLQGQLIENTGGSVLTNTSAQQEKSHGRFREIIYDVSSSQAGDTHRYAETKTRDQILDTPQPDTARSSSVIGSGVYDKQIVGSYAREEVAVTSSEGPCMVTSRVSDSEAEDIVSSAVQEDVIDQCAVSCAQEELTPLEQTPHPVQRTQVSGMEEVSPPNGVTEAGTGEGAGHCVEEQVRESAEDMEVWINTLRQLETPEIMRHQRVSWHPRSSPLSVYATLPPIKEDQGSPKSGDHASKCDHPDFTRGLKEEEEELEMIPLQNPNQRPPEEEKEKKPEQPERKYSWERSTDRPLEKSSPLDMMRKHSGDDTCRSATYKAMVTQNLSLRQSSIIGSLLLSDRLNKTAEKSEGKSSWKDSSLLLYKPPEKVPLQLKGENGQSPPEKEPAIAVSVLSPINDTSVCAQEDHQPQAQGSGASSPSQLDNRGGSASDLLPSPLPSKQDTLVASQFKAFPDAWDHTEKEHGKLNPRPGKIVVFSEAGYSGQSHAICSDVSDCTAWELQETISVHVIRGG